MFFSVTPFSIRMLLTVCGIDGVEQGWETDQCKQPVTVHPSFNSQ